MNFIEKRLAMVLAKWIVTAIILYYLWRVDFFVFLFVWLPHLITYVYEIIVEYGIVPVVRFYKGLWTLAIILLIILAILIFEFFYRVKRKDFVINGEFEGRVIWVKGLRNGWAYSVWDLKNYIQWKMGKKKDTDLITKALSNDTATLNGTLKIRKKAVWPDPFAIPIGPTISKLYVFYIRRRPFPLQIIPEKWFVPINTKIGVTFNMYTLPDLNFIRLNDPNVPGRYVYHARMDMADISKITPSKLTVMNRTLLGRAGKLVDKAILVDSETKKRDFESTFTIPQMTTDEGEYDE